LGATELGAQPALQYAKLMISLADWDLAEADEALTQVAENSSEVDALVRHLSMRAVMSSLTSREDVEELASRALSMSRTQGAHRWEPTLQVVLAVAKQDARLLRRCLETMAKQMHVSLLSVADVVGSALWMLDADARLLDTSIIEAPNRWLPILRRQLSAGNTANAHAAANLVARFGLASDVPRLVAFEWTYIRKSQLRALGRQLARRVAPTLVLHDLGRSEFQIGVRDLRLSQTRRKAASLLVYLASRPKQAATKEQVLEELWPDLDPAGAANSLHQTLYFLRRHIDPWYEERLAVDYVALESEMAYLDPDIVQVDSVAFMRQANYALESHVEAADGWELLKSYSGRFAPEFEYEEWAIAWRDSVHGAYLRLAQATHERFVAAGRVDMAVEVLARALSIDPKALELEESLVEVLLADGALAAAARQYEHFAAAFRAEYAIEPPPFRG
jgi:DNA-binding SARP family transcriptional activator